MTREEAIQLLSSGGTAGAPGGDAWNAYYGNGGFYNQAPSVQNAANDTFLQQPQVFNPIMANPGYNSGVSSLGYNPGQYANDQTMNTLANLLGGTPYTQTYNDSPFNIPPMNMVNINGQLYNAGLLAKAFQNGDPNFVAKMYGLTLNQPVLNSLQQQANYNAGTGATGYPSANTPNTNNPVTPPVTTPQPITPQATTTPRRDYSPTTPTATPDYTTTYPTYTRTATGNSPNTRMGSSPITSPTAASRTATLTDPINRTPSSTMSRVAYMNNAQTSPISGGEAASTGTQPTLGRPNYSGFSRQGFNW